MIKLRKFKASDAVLLHSGGTFSNNTEIAEKVWLEGMKECENHESYTGLIDGVPIGAGGVKMFWPGVGEVWAMYSLDTRKCLKAVVRTTRFILNRIIKNNNMHRVQAIVVRGDFKAARFMENLGFEAEALLEKYTADKRDAIMYALR